MFLVPGRNSFIQTKLGKTYPIKFRYVFMLLFNLLFSFFLGGGPLITGGARYNL